MKIGHWLFSTAKAADAMKPVLLSLSLFPAVVLGQWEVSLLGGAGLGRLPTDLMPITSRGETQEVQFGPGWIAGGQFSHALSRPFRFTTGLHWSCISGRDEYWSRGSMVNSSERRVGYVALPILVEAEAWRIRVGAGLQAGFLAMQHGRFTRELLLAPDSEEEFETNDLGLRRIDVGVVAQLRIGLVQRWSVGLRYYRGLSDIKDHEDMHLSPLWTEQAVLIVAYQLLPRKRTALRDAARPDEPSVD